MQSSKYLTSAFCLEFVVRISFFIYTRKREKYNPVLQIARQTVGTWVKRGQLLNIPDEVETTIRAANKNELYVAFYETTSYTGNAQTSGFNKGGCNKYITTYYT